MQPTEDFRKEKAYRIAECLQHSAKLLMQFMSDIARHTRKKPRFISNRTNYKNRRLYRHKYAILLSKIAIHRYMSDCQLRIILSQPIPKFKPGGINNNEKESTHASCTISETGPELINGSFVLNANAIQSLPTGQRDNI
jgi:hypothetical protein